MRAETLELAAIFGRPVHYIVPLYQRPYVWTRALQWEPLWEDLKEVADRQLDATTANDQIPHFLGAIVLERALMDDGLIDARTVIDGQQRLTTLQLIIAAARSLAKEGGHESPRKMFDSLLRNDAHLVRGADSPNKLLPTHRDRAAFREVMGDGVVASTGSHRMHEAYRYFRNAIHDWLLDVSDGHDDAKRLEALSTALWKRVNLVQISLEQGDNAQVIFETLNARGTPLLAADLIKNHLFQTATMQGSDIQEMYEQHWRVFDPEEVEGTGWWREEVQRGRLKRPRIDIFLNHWLAMVTGDEVVVGELFTSFKRYLANDEKKASDVLADLERYARVYETFENEPIGSELGQFIYRLNTLEVTTAYPALLWLLGPEGLEPGLEQSQALRAIESWLVRRMLVRATTKNYNVVFLSLLKSVRTAAEERGGRPLGADVQEFLESLRGESQAWPTDAAIRSSLQVLPLYSVVPRSRLRMVLEALEQAMHTGLTERVLLDTDLTVEHVLPQEWGPNWPLQAGVDELEARQVRDAAKHRLGNLTLATGKLNPSMSNGRWLEKRAALREHSLLRISSDIRNAEVWDEAAISERGERLIALALSTWKHPEAGGAEASDYVPATAITVLPAAGPPDPANPYGFASVLGIADEIGIGQELREIISVAREVGLWPKPDRYSVTLAPMADRRVALLTLWPQWNEGGSFRLWKSPTAFARHVPTVTLEAAQMALGESEGHSVLVSYEAGAFAEALRRVATPPDQAADSV